MSIWSIAYTCRPSSDVANAASGQGLHNAASGQGLHNLLSEISMENAKKWKHPPETPKTKNGLIRIIKMDKSTGQKRVSCKPCV